MDSKLVKTVAMHGPSISDPSKIVNRDVPEADVTAYRAAGYRDGYLREAADSGDAVSEVEATTVARPRKGRR